mgnify:FL=1
MSIWQQIYSHLKSEGFDVYSPGQHRGECIAPYIVVKDSGLSQAASFSSTRTLYDVMCYVPADQFSTLEPFVSEVKASLDKLYPMLVPMNFETGSFLDDTVKGHMISIQYRNARKIPMR